MPTIRESRELPYSAEQMFALVADVRRYPEFLPWVVATRVRSEQGDETVADMMVGFKALREKFTSRVRKQPPERITVDYIEGPLSHLENIWRFEPVTEHSCRIDFCVNFAFRNPVFEKLAGSYLDRAFRKMVGAFEERAAQLYGSSSSSAHKVA
ncbi:type II toxin-antitoxin system RatA family toxin [Croceicoccus sp. F390]|uniref:Type II toxin-antitoxin system RatA family toxin n=1 Tax=Croceicoccus esteveae TaxID=3075597 RepID=A0ABU2ZM26_9SPHN|nr:type II toxin-antitoxin system RatA family toxin [Croceicoccus sp. F390]MDT0576629.1 type II toxin-antitoxin system RatA family toxin [Croceicoccus sp. F390]